MASGGNASPRVLLCGDVEGRLHQLCKRVASVNKVNGPFDCLLCVGPFFSSTPGEDLELKDYMSGSKSLPLPTFFIGDYGVGAKEILDAALLAKLSNSENDRKEDTELPGIPICANLRWLRGSGVVKISGLQVAYLGGKFSPTAYHENGLLPETGIQRRGDVEKLVDDAAGVGIVDILLTNEWPQGILSGTDTKNLPEGINPRTVGTPVTAEVGKEIKSRYHVAGTEGISFAREPYRNPGTTYVTRFLGLAAVGNEKKQKSFHALSPTPASEMKASELEAPVPGSTSSPYETTSSTTTNVWHGSQQSNNGVSGRVEGGVHGSSSSKAMPQWAAKVEAEGQEGQYWRYSAPPAKRRKEGGGGEEKVCFEYINKGSCSRGDACRFKHSRGDGEPIPKGVCFDFISKGKCERGDECKYRHSMDEEGKRDGGGEGSLLGAPKGVCYDWFRKGTCERGSDCRFKHSTEVNEAQAASRPPAGPCWFCLSSAEVEAHLVASVADHCYLALAKGPLVAGHMLLLPIEHFPNILSLPSDSLAELHRYKEGLKQCFSKEGKTLLLFERYLQLRAGTHAHVQVVPLPKAKAGAIRGAFEAAAERAGFSFQVIPAGSDPQAVLDQIKRLSLGGNYFTVELPDGITMAHGISPGDKFPMQFGREVVAELLGMPERVDWKACKLTKEEETAMVESFKAKFQDFDIM